MRIFEIRSNEQVIATTIAQINCTEQQLKIASSRAIINNLIADLTKGEINNIACESKHYTTKILKGEDNHPIGVLVVRVDVKESYEAVEV